MHALIWTRLAFRVLGALLGGLGAWYILKLVPAKSANASSPLAAAMIALSTTACRDVLDELYGLIKQRGETKRAYQLLKSAASEAVRRSHRPIPFSALTDLGAGESLRVRIQDADVSHAYARLLTVLASLRSYCTTYEDASPGDAQELLSTLESLSNYLRS